MLTYDQTTLVIKSLSQVNFKVPLSKLAARKETVTVLSMSGHQVGLTNVQKERLDDNS